MRILCLDIATQTGWALISINKEVKVDFGSFTLDKENRLSDCYKTFNKLFKKLKPDIILVEDVYLRNVKSYRILSMLQAGMYLGAIHWNKKAKILKANATSIRKVLKLHNEERKKIKESTLIFINKLLKSNITNDNEADAIGIGVAYINNKGIFAEFTT